MRNIFFILVFALFGLVSTLQAQSNNKIGYIDLQSVIKNSKAGKAAKTSFESEFKKKRVIIESKAKVLAQEEQDFINQAPLMDEDARNRRSEIIQQQKKELTRLRDDFREVLQKRDFELTQKILKELENVIKTIGSKEGYALIVEKTESGVIYGSDGVDITQKVITAYDLTN